MQTVTVAERPDLVEAAARLTDAFHEYNHHGEVLGRYWSRLPAEQQAFQFHLLDDDSAVVARGQSIPVRWDGSIDDLRHGIDGAIARGFDEGGANVL